MLRHSARLEVTLCGWQDVKIQWLGNQLGHGTEARRSLIQSVTHATGTKLQQTLLALLCNFTSYYFLSGRKKKEKRLGDAAVPSYGFLLARTPTQTFLQTQTHSHTNKQPTYYFPKCFFLRIFWGLFRGCTLSLPTLYVPACHVRVTAGDSGPCCVPCPPSAINSLCVFILEAACFELTFGPHRSAKIDWQYLIVNAQSVHGGDHTRLVS